MRKPRIGMIPSCHNGDPYQLNPSARCITAVERAGGEVAVIDYHIDKQNFERLMRSFDGFLLQGGGDVDPSRYAEPRHTQCGPAVAERDELELAAMRIILERDLPLLSICRGIQLLNVALGGTLHQDLPSELGVNHDQGADIAPLHIVQLDEGSLVARVARSTRFSTNSWHHQSVKELGGGLVVSAHAQDGVIEAVESPSSRFLLGLQWHPECTIGADEPSIRFFEALIHAC